MPELLVRDVPEDVVEALRRRAAEHGRSDEAEHRSILEEALCVPRAGIASGPISGSGPPNCARSCGAVTSPPPRS